MDLTIRGADITVTPEIREFADARVSKLDRFMEHVVDAKLELKRDHRRNNASYVVAQLTIKTGRDLLRAEEHDQDVRKAINLVVDKMEKQARRVAERRSARKRSGAPVVAAAELMDAEPEVTDATDDFDVDGVEEIGAVVRTKRFAVKPMDVDEAIEQMELLGHDFFLFHNADESKMNVLYRRKDGSYGLLAPDIA
jgi:putative sigma-54 modulation protein